MTVIQNDSNTNPSVKEMHFHRLSRSGIMVSDYYYIYFYLSSSSSGQMEARRSVRFGQYVVRGATM